MAEYISNDVQTVEAGQNILLTDSNPCTKGFIMHESGAGVFTLRGPVNSGTCNCNRFARYQVMCNCNIAIPDGGTVGEISIAIATAGEPIQTSRARVTPTATGAYDNVTSIKQINVPSGCCRNIAIENTSGQAIDVQNVNLIISRIA